MEKKSSLHSALKLSEQSGSIYLSANGLADESPEIWEILHARILAPHLEEKPPEDYLVLIRELNLKDTAEAHNKMNSGKRMFKRFFRKVIEEFAMDETELEDELLESNSRPWEQSGQQKAVG